MNIKLHYYYKLDPGIFSRFMRLIIDAIKYDNIEHIYFSTNNNENPFDWIFDQYYDANFNSPQIIYIGSYVPKELPDGLGLIEESDDLKKLKLLVSKIKFQKHIQDWIDDNSHQFNENYLGVHIRQGDMLRHHPHYGLSNMSDYIQKIKEIINEEKIDKIFVASDNNQSITTLQENFGSLITFTPNMIRAEQTNFIEPTMLLNNNLSNKTFWEESFKECLLLSKCGQLLCKQSNLSNTSIIFSNTIKKTYRI